MGQRQYGEVPGLLDQAKKINPQQQYLWLLLWWHGEDEWADV